VFDTDGYKDFVCFPDSSSDNAIAAVFTDNTQQTNNKQQS